MGKLAERIIADINSDLINGIREGEEMMGINHASLEGMNSRELKDYLNDLGMKYQQNEQKKPDTASADMIFEESVYLIEKAIKKGNVPSAPFRLDGYPETVLEFEGAAKILISDAEMWQRKAEKNEMARKIFYPAKRDRVIALTKRL